MVQAHIFFSGTVQGIGFRYAVLQSAQNLKITGWVRNLDDGRVEAVFEGPKEDIEKLCESVEKHFEGYIQSKEIDFFEPQNQFKDFKIVH